ncbi:MAG: M1 family aminopeptidase [Pyrinomonadaceae bacterium]
MLIRFLLLFMALSVSAFAQVPPIEPGVSQELAKWRSARYSDVRYKLNLTLEKMSPVLKGSLEIRVKLSEPPASAGGQKADSSIPPIVLDWRKIKGHEEKSTVSNVSVNGKPVSLSTNWPPANAGGSDFSDHLIFTDGVVVGENVIKLDFTSPILPSGSAITRYVDKEDGSEFLYSLFVPSDASTAFPVFDQPDLKARFTLNLKHPGAWKPISNSPSEKLLSLPPKYSDEWEKNLVTSHFRESEPISTYVFAFAAGPWERVSSPGVSNPSVGSPHVSKGAGDNSGARMSQAPSLTVGLPTLAAYTGGSGSEGAPLARDTPEQQGTLPTGRVSASDVTGSIYVRKSQAAKFKPHAAEVFWLNREAVKYFEQYFDYKFPFPKYDLVLIPEFPFGGMEHAGATFLREASIIFPQEPTKNDHINRATLIFHEAAHQWFGDTVTMRWFDDLWLKEGFATFTAYKALEKIMPEMNAWKVFYERIKQGAYATDSTKGTTPIYQEIKNLSAAKSAYGNIVYNKAPAFLRQAEFYLGEDKFQTAVRSFLKKHEFGNAGWEDLVKEFEVATGQNQQVWAKRWVTRAGLPRIQVVREDEENGNLFEYGVLQQVAADGYGWPERINLLTEFANGERDFEIPPFPMPEQAVIPMEGHPFGRRVRTSEKRKVNFLFPNYGDYGYGIFLLDAKSRDYVLKNIQNEKDPFLRSMMWGALWDSVREGELDPREFVELVVRVQSSNFSLSPGGKETSAGNGGQAKACTLNCDDESTTALLLNRVGTAMNYYLDETGTQAPSPASAQRAETALAAKQRQRPAAAVQAGSLRSRVEEMLIAGLQNSPTLGQRITYYRAFLNVASSERARGVLKELLAGVSSPRVSKGAADQQAPSLTVGLLTLRSKDKFDIVTRLLILSDPEAPRLLAELEKAETSDDAKRYAYAAKAGIASGENKAKYWNDFVNNKEISESWIEAAFGPWNSIRHSNLTLPYLQKALQELPNHKRNRKIFFVNGWLGAFIGGQRSEEALAIVNKVLADYPNLDNDLRLKILENVDVIERAVKIRQKY